MNQFFRKSIHFFTIPLFTLIVVASCDKDMNVMLDNSATGNVGVTLVDSFTVNTATTQLNNLPSANQGVLLVGRSTNPNLGSISASSYFRIGFSRISNDIPTTARFDSLNLIIKPATANNYVGDTSATQTLHVHRVTEDITTQTAKPQFPNQAIPFYVTGTTLFNDQTFDYDPQPIGSSTFRPSPSRLDSVNIRLADAIGQDFFDKVRTGATQFSSNDNFIEYFKGLVLVPAENNSTVIAFSDTVEMRINYSYPGTDGHRQHNSKTLSIVQPNFQYNHIVADFTQTVFEGLNKNEALATSETAGLTYVQAGSGTVAKLSFPTLKEFLQDENIAINKAELIIETTSKVNPTYPVPNSLMLLVADKDGVPVSFLEDAYAQRKGEPQQAIYVPAKEMGQNGSYSFNLLFFLQQLRSSQQFDNSSFYLSNSAPSLYRTLNTAEIATENGKPKIKLNILYTKFR